MLIKTYHLEATTPPCDPGGEALVAIARLNVDISAVLPYLNSVLPGALYNARAPTTSWEKGKYSAVFWPYKIALSGLTTRVEADAVAQEMIDLANQTWERRAEITPNYQEPRRLKPFEVYGLLPRTNCRACGEQTCFVFAAKLAAGQVKLADCTLLVEPQYARSRVRLEAMV